MGKKQTVCVWYITRDEKAFMDLSILTMHAYKWVTKIIILHTDPIRPPFMYEDLYHKVTEGWAYYGDGFDKSVENDGFNEIAARNYCIEKAEKTNCDWLLQCDSDEFYTKETGEVIENHDKDGFEAINIQCNHFITPIQYKINDSLYRNGCHDPHLRAWKSGLGIRYQRNGNEEFMSQWANKSNHCVNNGESYKTGNQAGMFHIHLHDMIGRKKRPTPSYERIIEDNRKIMPECYIQAWRKENEIG